MIVSYDEKTNRYSITDIEHWWMKLILAAFRQAEFNKSFCETEGKRFGATMNEVWCVYKCLVSMITVVVKDGS